MDLEYSIDPYGYQAENSDITQNYNWIDIADNYQTVTFTHNDNASNDMIDFGFENTNLLDLCKKPAFKNNW